MNKSVLVTTAHRGVFFGELISEKDKQVTLANARCAIYWATTGGFFELASIGPNAKSKIGSVAPEVLLHDVTAVVACSEQAIKAWKEHA